MIYLPSSPKALVLKLLRTPKALVLKLLSTLNLQVATASPGDELGLGGLGALTPVQAYVAPCKP